MKVLPRILPAMCATCLGLGCCQPTGASSPPDAQNGGNPAAGGSGTGSSTVEPEDDGGAAGGTSGGSAATVVSCAAATPLEGGGSLAWQSTAGAERVITASHPSCLGVPTLGPERVYLIPRAAGGAQRLVVTVSPRDLPGTDAFDPVLYLTQDCTETPTCLAAQDSRGGGSTEVLEQIDTGRATEDLYLVVDGYDFQSAGGTFDLTVDLIP